MDQKTIQRRLTAAFVQRDPVSIRFRTVSNQTMPDGGTRRVRGELRRSQTVTLVEPGSSGYGPADVSVNGRTEPVDYMLLGLDTDVRLHDEFTHEDHDFRVDKIMPSNGYETRAYVVRIR